MKIRVLIPIYRSHLAAADSRALEHNASMLAAHDVALIVPQDLDTEEAARLAPHAEIVRVSDEWLGTRNGIAGYNAMMLSREFYAMFRDWDYILICHTDAWIFRDELTQWAEKGYDCVAAPWIRRRVYDLPVIKQYMALRQRAKHSKGLPCRADMYGRIGNGGLTLRRTQAFIAACEEYPEKIDEYLHGGSHLYNEDLFWATVPATFRYPTPQEALGFAFDTNPAYCYRLTQGRLPMGCHSWSKSRMWRFWKNIIK